MNELQEYTEVSWVPAHVVLTGTKKLDRQKSVIADMHPAAKAYLSYKKGKLGEAVRESMGNDSITALAKQVMAGNYRPIAQVIAVLVNKNISIMDRGDWKSLRWTLEFMLSNLKNEGYNAKGEESADRKSIVEAINLMVAVQDQCDEFVRQRREERERIEHQDEAQTEQAEQAA